MVSNQVWEGEAQLWLPAWLDIHANETIGSRLKRVSTPPNPVILYCGQAQEAKRLACNPQPGDRYTFY